MTFAVGFPAGAAAMYGAQHGLDVDAAFALNNVRIFGYFLSLLLLGGSTLGIALSALADGVHRRWIGGFGVVTGVALLVSTPLAGIGQQDWGTLVCMVWFVGVGVLLLRHRDPTGTGRRIGPRERRHRALLTRGEADARDPAAVACWSPPWRPPARWSRWCWPTAPATASTTWRSRSSSPPTPPSAWPSSSPGRDTRSGG